MRIGRDSQLCRLAACRRIVSRSRYRSIAKDREKTSICRNRISYSLMPTLLPSRLRHVGAQARVEILRTVLFKARAK